MRKFWGRNDSNRPQYKFSRDDEQIVALNYENLCDSDYLARLFLQDNTNIGKDEASEGRLSDSASAHPEISEDVIIFGNSLPLGKYFFKKRFQREILSSLKANDSLSAQISKQVAVFDHMATLLLEKCNSDYIQKSAAVIKSTKGNDLDSLSSLALRYCFDFLGESKDQTKVSFPRVQAILISLMHFFKMTSESELLTLPQFGELRKLFQKSMSRITSPDFLNLLDWSKKEFEEEIKSVLSGIYGCLGVGLLTNNLSDVVNAIHALVLLMIIVEEKLDYYLSRIKELLTATASNAALSNSNPTTAATTKNIPAKIQGKMKNPPKPSPQKSKDESIEDVNTNQYYAESRDHFTQNEPISNNNQSINNNNNNNAAEVPLKSYGSAPKLWDKSNPKIEPTKAKISAKGKEKEQRLLYEYLETPKEGMILPQPNPQTITANHVLVNYNSAVAPGSASGTGKRSGNNNHESPIAYSKNKEAVITHIAIPPAPSGNYSNKETTVIPDLTPRSHLKRIEKEIKSVYNTIFNVPQLVLTMFGEYCNQFSATISPTTSPLLANSTAVTGLATTSTPKPSLLTNSKSKSSSHLHHSSPGKKSYPHKVYSSGQNSYGELGLGDVNIRKSFSRISALDDKGIISIGAGNEHSLFVTQEGKLFAVGYNDNGQCGVGSAQQVRQLTLVQALEDEEVQQVHVYNGCEHTLVLTKDGKLFSIGYNYRGQLGLGSTNSESLPRPVRTLLQKKVVLAACSYHHSVILCSDGSIFSCGRNDSGQLGHGDTVDKKIPHPITSAPRNITSVSCGQFHTVVSTVTGAVFVSGKNDYGQLGLENTSNVKVLTKINVPVEMDLIKQVCCGYYHTLLLSATGIVGGFGRNDYGQLGMGHAQPKIFQCTIVAGLRDKGVTLLAAGCYHSIGVTLNGMLYVFGRNNHGQLATGDLEERHNPHPIDDFIGQRVLAVAAGFYHTLVLTAEGVDTATAAVSTSTGFLQSMGLLSRGNDHPFEPSSALTTTSEVDVKQLVIGLKKDLELLCGYEYLDKNHEVVDNKPSSSSGNHHNINNNHHHGHHHPSVVTSLPPHSSDSHRNSSNNSNQDNNSSNNRIARPNFDQTSSISCRELITVLIRHFTIFEQKDLLSITMDHPTAITTALTSMTSLLYLLWEIIADPGSFRINLPMSVADAQLLLKKLLPSIGKFLLVNKAGILELLQTEKEAATKSTERETEKSDLFQALVAMEIKYQNVSVVNNFTGDHISRIREHIQTLFKVLLRSSFSEDQGLISQDTQENKHPISITQSIEKLRWMILLIYFDPRLLSFYSEEESLSLSICEVFLTNHDLLFPTPEVYLSLLQYLSQTLLANNVLDQRVYSLYLRLLSCIGKIFHTIEETMRLFQQSKASGLKIFHTLLTIYHYYSKYLMERKALTATDSTSSSSRILLTAISTVDIRRVLTVLEQGVNHFIKCGIPLILHSSSATAVSPLEGPEEVIIHMIQDSEKIIDYALQQSLSEETLSHLRYGTQMPSILPSTFLFAIGAAKKGFTYQKLYPHLYSFLQKLQQITKYEIQSYQQKVLLGAGGSGGSERRNSGENISIELKSKEVSSATSAVSAVIATTSTGKEEEMSESLAEELLYLKKDQSQISWWFRLLKMTVNLLSRMKLGHLHRYPYITSDIETSNDPATIVVPESLIHHRIWFTFEITEEYLRQWQALTSVDPLMTFSTRTMEICSSLRETEKHDDQIYKMLSISTHTNFSGALLRQLEQLLMELILSVTLPNLPITLVPIRYYSTIFHTVTPLTKLIHSKRSQLVSNSGSLSWVEILSTLVTYTGELTQMLTKSVTVATKTLHVLPSYFSLQKTAGSASRTKQLWRKTLLTVFTYVRWKRAVKFHYSTLPGQVVDFITRCLQYLTNDFTKVTAITNDSSTDSLSTKRISQLYQSLLGENEKHTIINQELAAAVNLLTAITPLSLKSDVIVGLIASFREKRRLINSIEPLQLMIPSPCSQQNAKAMKAHILALEQTIMKIIQQPLQFSVPGAANFHYTMIELQLLSNAIRFLEVFYSSVKIRYNGYRSNDYQFTIPMACKLLLLLFERYRNWSAVGEEKVFTRKVGNLRERNTIAKRTIFILLSYLQAMMMIQIEKTGDNYHQLLLQLLPSFNQIIHRLQLFRNEETFSNPEEAAMGFFINMSNTAVAANSPSNHTHSTAATTTTSNPMVPPAILLPAPTANEVNSLVHTPTTSSLLTSPTTNTNATNRLLTAGTATTPAPLLAGNSSSTLVNAAKKRCQDLIMKPLEFSRNSEGIVIQGEKLLNSCKGCEFSIVTWILLTNPSTGNPLATTTPNGTTAANNQSTRGNFIIGKISHNEAWPVVLLKADHKLEIIYGHNNEYEKATTENSIPLHSWTHLAIVVDPKKIKIFINGVLDVQISTVKGNNKALMFPLVIGSCPTNVRTRVNNVKEGFDGMLAQCKYYSRALSPIHVKVIYDHGPPETTDISAKIIFHLLASLKYLMQTVEVEGNQTALQQTAELCHFIFMTDSSRRNRYAALQVMIQILKFNYFTDLSLTQLPSTVTTTTGHPYFPMISSVPLSTVPFLLLPTLDPRAMDSAVIDEVLVEEAFVQYSFQEKLIWYLLRLAGCNWMQGNIIEQLLLQQQTTSVVPEETATPTATTTAMKIQDFLPYLPRSCFNKSIIDSLQGNHPSPSTSASGALHGTTASQKILPSQFPERICSQEDPLGELSYQAIAMILSLADQPSWKKAIISILRKLMTKATKMLRATTTNNAATTGATMTLNPLMMIDLMGMVLLLGGVPNGAYFGAYVQNYFDRAMGVIIQINNTVNGATLLSYDDSQGDYKAMKVRLNDLQFTDVGHTLLPTLQLTGIVEAVAEDMIGLLEYFSPFVHLLGKDYLAVTLPESAFQLKSLVKVLRPLESFVFVKLLSGLTEQLPLETVTALLLTKGGERLWTVLRELTLAAMSYQLPSRLESSTTELPITNSAMLSMQWFSNVKYISSLPSKWIYHRFPLESEETYLFDLMHKQFGFCYDLEIRKEFSQQGLLSRVLFASSVSSSLTLTDSFATTSSTMTPPRTYAMNDLFLKSIQFLELTFSEKELTQVLSYYQYLRQTLLGLMKQLLNSRVLEVKPASTTDTLALIPTGSTAVASSSFTRFIQQLVATRSASTNEKANMKLMLLMMMGTNPLSIARVEAWNETNHLQQLIPVTRPSSSTSQTVLPAWLAMSEQLLQLSPTSSSHSHMIVSVIHSLGYAVVHAATALLQHRHQKAADNILLTTDLFDRLLCNLYYWLELPLTTTNTAKVFEEMATLLITELLPVLPLDESEVLEFKLLQFVVYLVTKVASKVLRNELMISSASSSAGSLLDMMKGISFIELRTRVQDQLLKYKGHNLNDISSYAYNLIQLVTMMEVIQRRVIVSPSSVTFHKQLIETAQQAPSPSKASSKQNAMTAMLSKIQSLELASPKLITVRSHSIDVDLTPCLQSVQSALTAEILDSLSLPLTTLEHLLIEVAFGISGGGNNNSEFIYETMFFGASNRLVQSGLMPDTTYLIKCRVYLTPQFPLAWSTPFEFHTEKGLLFTFDGLKCGADILLSEDHLTASYTGDDAWSSLLSTRSFSSGVTSWEVRINQSSTAYIFIGIAASTADLNTFLGGCANGWGLIGEQALYHNREKVKVYGEPFTTGDIIGVTLDLNLGTLSFTKNKKSLGVAFDKIYGDLYPAVAFYNIGQEVQIIPDSFKTTCAHEAIPISPGRLNLDEVSMMTELLQCLTIQAPLSNRMAVVIAEHCNQWCNSLYVRYRTVSKREIFLATESPLLKRFNLMVGEKVRTFYGVAEVAGTAYNRIWFKVNSAGEVWFVNNQQIIEGRAKKLFMRCTYQTSTSGNSSTSKGTTTGTGGSLFIDGATTALETSNNNPASLYSITFDSATVMDLLDPVKWTVEMDEVLLDFLTRQSEISGVEPWQITSERLFENYRVVQQQLTRITMQEQPMIAHHWGISGPKRKAVIARLGLIRVLNQYLEMYLPFFISDSAKAKVDGAVKTFIADEFFPVIETYLNLTSSSATESQKQLKTSHTPLSNRIAAPLTATPHLSSSVCFPWDDRSRHITTIQSLARGPLQRFRHLLFRPLKFQHFHEVIKRTVTRPAKTEDDYDYPDNLPHVKINRLKSLRAREAAELLGLSGEDVLLNTMFCQLWRELKVHSVEKLRISYTHPMDDGQSRSFKIKFEGEGVDDYGGPYREIFQQICNELQLLHPTAGVPSYHNHHQEADLSSSQVASNTTGGSKRLTCFYPLLQPTPNWTNDVSECQEKYRFMFIPTNTTASAGNTSLFEDLYYFFGQLVGIAIRSRITLDVAFTSYFWKSVVGETLTEKDLASFDQGAYDYLLQLQTVYQNYLKQQQGKQGTVEAKEEDDDSYELIRDLTWTATLSNGSIVELRENGYSSPVTLAELGSYLTQYLECRFQENATAIHYFRQGLFTIIPETAITILSWKEFQSIVCGAHTIDIHRLQENTEYDDDVSPEDDHIIAFWEVLQEFNEIEKTAFLKFVWARPSLPPKDVEFTQKMRILSIATEETPNLKQDNFLPKAHTCFFSINLPKYSSKKILAEKLRYAIFNCTEMDGDYRTTETEVPGWGVNANQFDTSFQSIDY